VLGVDDSERCDAGRGDSKKLMATNGGGELEVTLKAVVRHCRWRSGLCEHPCFQSFQSESDKKLRDDKSLISAVQAGLASQPIGLLASTTGSSSGRLGKILNINAKWSAIGISSALRWIKYNCSCSLRRICCSRSIISSSRTCMKAFHYRFPVFLCVAGSVMVWKLW
jgi:hypothetical protein